MDQETQVLLDEVKATVNQIPEYRTLELLSTFIAATTHAVSDVVSKDVLQGVLTSVARLMARDLWEELGEPKGLENLLESLTKTFPSTFEGYITRKHVVVRNCPIRDISEKENIGLGGTLCVFSRGLFWYFLQRAVGKDVKIKDVKPGYYACLYELEGAELDPNFKTTETYEEYLEKSLKFMNLMLTGLLSTLDKVLGKMALGYLVNAGLSAGYAHGSILPATSDLRTALTATNYYLVVWEGKLRLGEESQVIEEKRYELSYPKSELFCALFYGYISGLMSASLGKKVVFDNYDCSSVKVVNVEE